MLVVPYFFAAVGSSTMRIIEKFLSTSKDAERFLNNEISFQEATDNIVKNIRIYVPLTTAKLICDTIVLTMTGLISCGYQAFQNGIKLFLNHFFTVLRNCSISLILTQFKHLFNKPKDAILSVSMIDFCVISNYIHLLIVNNTDGLLKSIQLELMKYWLECMGIIRAVAESHNIDFVKYMNKTCPREINTSSLNDDHSLNFTEVQWERVKDPDFSQTITVSLEEINCGTMRDVTVRREIRDNNKKTPEVEEAVYSVIIEPGCADGKIIRFIEAGHRDPVNIPADLLVEIRTAPHQLYHRSGSDLIYKAKVSLEDALKGTSVQVPLMDGSMNECDPCGVIKPDTEIVIHQGGLPDPANDSNRGRLIVKFDIEFPDVRLGMEPIEQYIHNENSDTI